MIIHADRLILSNIGKVREWVSDTAVIMVSVTVTIATVVLY